jgi:glycosyltransferase involved in cell wall biosynthesis
LVYEAGLRERIGRRPWVRVYNYPPAERVSQLLHASDIGATPMMRGVGENSGSMLATMAHALPTVVTQGEARLPADYPVIPVPACDSVALADPLARRVRSEQLRRELGVRARDFARRFDWRHVAEQTEVFIRSLIERNDG